MTDRIDRSTVPSLASRMRDDSGAALATYLILFPVLVMFVELIVLGGRVAATGADIQSAAREAARAGTLAAGPGSLPSVISGPVSVGLAGKGFRCQSPSVTVGAATNFVAEGQPGGQVEVVVTCTVQLSDLDLLSIPGSITIRRSAVEPIDTYRAVD